MQTVMTLGRLLVSLAVVLGLMWLLARRVRKGGARRGRRQGIEVLERASLSRSASVALVRVHGRTYVLGVADAAVSVLSDLTGDVVDEAASQAALDKQFDIELDPEALTLASAGATKTTRPHEAEVGAHRPTDSPAVVRPPRRAGLTPRSRVQVRDGAKVSSRPIDRTRAGRRSPGSERGGALSGSALSPQTWQQTLNTLRDLTART